jgi:hypothetical protein
MRAASPPPSMCLSRPTSRKRIGVGGALGRVALAAFVGTARDLLEGRELDGLRAAMSGRELTDIFQRRRRGS